MAAIFARLMHNDGRYHYGLTTLPAPHLGPLYVMNVEGDGELPPAPDGSSTPEEHEEWVRQLQECGFTVRMTPVHEEEP